MTLKVAFDVSIPASRFDTPDPRHGIYNVTEALLKELADRDDVEVSPVGLCGDDALLTSIKTSFYVQHLGLESRCSAARTFTVAPGLTNLYSDVFRSTLSGDHERRGRLSPRRAVLLAARSALYRMTYRYGWLRPKPVLNWRRYDLFHCPHLSLPAKEITSRLPRVITVYDLIPVLRPDFVTAETAATFRKNLAKIDVARDWVVCISDFTRQEFCEYTKISPERAFVAPLAADNTFRPEVDVNVLAEVRLRYGIPEGDYFLTLAAPQPRKNLAHLIRCFFRLLDEQPELEVNLVLAGSKELGWMYEEIFDAAESSSKHRDRVIFSGFVADEDLAALYSGALAFVFPSLYEGFGLPPLEAMQCGTPVIASNVTATPEVVGDGGIMVDPQDADALCQALLDIVNQPDLRRRLSEKGRERAKQFTWARCAAETVNAYRAAVSDSRGNGRNA